MPKTATELNKVVWFTVLVMFWGCSDTPSIDPLPPEARILAFGDSLTVGVGASDGRSYPEVLSALSNRMVVNAGVSGETTDDGLARLTQLLDGELPDLLILIEGGNDLLRGKSPDVTRDNLASMIQLAQSKSVPVVLVGVPEKSLFSYSAAFYEELADEFNLVYDGTLIGKLMRDSSMKSDPIHFNDAGYARMAHSIHELLLRSGAL